MAEEYVSAAVKIATGAAAGNVGSVVDELVTLAFSVPRCRAKCQALAEKVSSVHKAILDLEENPATFNTQDHKSNVSKFMCVVKDCISLVKRFKTKKWLVRVLLSLKLESDFDCLDQRLEQCIRFFKLDLQMGTYTTANDISALTQAMLEEVRQANLKLDQLRSLEQSHGQGSPVSGNIVYSGGSMYGGYLLEATMEPLGSSPSGSLIKVLLFSSQQTNYEAAIMKLVSDCEQILQFFGTWSDQNNCYNVMERPGTQIITLDERIKLDHSLTDPLLKNDWRLKRQVALDIATGLGYLHCAGILHRNLRSPHIFLADDQRPKIFGLFQARMKVKPSEKKWTSVEQIRWAAPEMLPKTRPEFTEKCDIFSLGVIFWEIITDEYPFSHIDSAMRLMKERTSEKRKLEFPIAHVSALPDFYKEFVKVATDCMDELPQRRPEIGAVIDRLTRLQPEQMQK